MPTNGIMCRSSEVLTSSTVNRSVYRERPSSKPHDSIRFVLNPAQETIYESAHYSVPSSAGGVDGGVNACAPRLLVSLGAGASADIIEEFGAASSNTAYFTNAVAEVFLAEGAQLTHGCGTEARFRPCLISGP